MLHNKQKNYYEEESYQRFSEKHHLYTVIIMNPHQ